MRRSSRAAVAALAVIGASCAPVTLATQQPTSAPVTTASFTCDKWASNAVPPFSGNGTEGAPFRSLDQLVSALAPGQTGCLAGTEYDLTATLSECCNHGVVNAGGGTNGNPITIRSNPDGRVKVYGSMQINENVHHVVLTDLEFAGPRVNAAGDPVDRLGSPLAGRGIWNPKGKTLNVFGDQVTITGNDLHDPFSICIGGGRLGGGDNWTATDLVIEDNLIHGCGMSPKVVWTAADSGAHGVYLEQTQNATVTNNFIFGNRTRGVQTYPKNDQIEIAHNLFDGNATHVNLGSEVSNGADMITANANIHDNVMLNRVTDFFPAKNASEVFGNFPVNYPAGTGNTVHDNCMVDGNAGVTGYGFDVIENNLAVPEGSYRGRSWVDLPTICLAKVPPPGEYRAPGDPTFVCGDPNDPRCPR